MSVEIPENMEEVAMKIAQYKVRGEELTEEGVINDAVKESMQAYMDEALEGHYDDVAMEGDELVVTDFMGKEVGRIKPSGDSWVADFKASSDDLFDRLAAETTKIVGGR